MNDFKPRNHEIVQPSHYKIEQNFRDEKASASVRSACQLQSFRGKNAGTEPTGDAQYNCSVAYCYHAEKKLHLRYQANSIKNTAGNLVSDVSGECLTTLHANF